MSYSVELRDAEAIFTKHWGHPEFRSTQAEVIQAALDQKDVLAVLPTGYGKSACFQVPALMANGTALVISPLIALMKDQVDDCLTRDIPASYVNSHVDEDEQIERLDGFAEGRYKIFYVAPERIRSKTFLEALGWADVSYLVVDEAHCASRWGHDFRPMYSRIHVIVDILAEQDKRPPILAVTATATADIEDDIAKAVGMKGEYARFVADPIRPNLAYKIKRGSPWSNIRYLVRAWDTYNGRHIVYVGTRNGSEKVAEIIKEQLNPEDVGVYHAGLSKNEREKIQNNFKAGRTPIIVATCAFGMGIDVPNIRNVVHFGIPGSLEDYIQETGRAGRDGKSSQITLLVENIMRDDKSVSLRHFFLDMQNPPFRLFEIVWEWLHDTLEEGETLRQSAASVANALKRQYPAMDISDGAVNGVLSTMEAYGLVHRTYASTSSVLDVDVALTREWYNDTKRQEFELTKKAREVLKYLWEEVVAPSVNDQTKRAEIIIDRPVLAEQLGTSEATLRKYIKELGDEGMWDVNRTYSGKTTRIRNYGADLEEHAPKAEIEAKRAREKKRLAHMIAYADTPDRLQYIRDYFMKGL